MWLKYLRSALIALFIAVEAVLAVLLQVLPAPLCNHLSFLSVVLACLFCPVLASRTPAYFLTQAALAFTVLADSVLVYNRMEQAPLAMCAFSLAQLAYGARILQAAGRHRRLQLLLRATLSLVALGVVAIVAGESADVLAYIALFYFANLVTNAICVLPGWRRSPLLALGLLLFVFCDIFVGFSMLSEYVPLPDTVLMDFLTSPPINMAWVFYSPCLVLLSLSPREQ